MVIPDEPVSLTTSASAVYVKNNMRIHDLQSRDTHDLETSSEIGGTTTLRSLVSGFSIEITTREASRIDDFRHHLPRGTEVYIVATPSTQPGEVVALSKRLREEEMIPVPHITARSVTSAGALDRWLHDLYVQADVRAALVIAGGNYEQPMGPYGSSMSLVESGILERHGVNDLRFAGHPEGHPTVSDIELMAALIEKQAYGERKQLTVSLVTQFFFDFAPVVKWATELDRIGITLPVRIGLHGVASLSGLMRQARYCGVGASVEVLAKQPARMFRLATVATPERLLHSLARYSTTTNQTRFSDCHFFPLGNFEKTARWVTGIARGDLESHDGGGSQANTKR